MSRPHSRFSSGPQIRINGKIRAREVRVIDGDGKQLGVLSLHEAIRLAQSKGVDLVEVAPNATPPVCRLVDYGKYLYEKSKETKEARKHQHANKVKEVQLSPSIDPHDFSIKRDRAIEFLAEEMKVKVVLKFRGREMAHKDIGLQVIDRFIKEVETYGHPDAPPKLVGRGVVLMLSPLPRSKRAKAAGAPSDGGSHSQAASSGPSAVRVPPERPRPMAEDQSAGGFKNQSTPFANTPFANLDLKVEQGSGDQEATGS